MSDIAVFVFGTFVTLLCSAAVGILIYGAAEEREDEISPERRAAPATPVPHGKPAATGADSHRGPSRRPALGAGA